MSLRLRIIPLTVVVASMFLMIKIVALIQGGQELSESLFVTQVVAETKPAPPPDPKPEEKKAEKPEEKPADKTEKKPDEKEAEKSSDKAADVSASGDGATPAKEGEAGAKKEEGAAEGKPKKETKKGDNPNVSTTPGDISDRRYTAVEVELLQKLSRRREELDNWESNLQIKETTLNAAEKRIDEKIAQVEAMKKAVSAALAEYNKIEDTEITSLVKIYENMKPADAARIFDELERPILLLIVDRMSEKKAAPILAGMDPKKAKQLTVDLAEQRRLKNSTMGAAATAAANASGDAATPATTPATPAPAPGK